MSKSGPLARLIGSVLATLFVVAILLLAFCKPTDRYRSANKVATSTREVAQTQKGLPNKQNQKKSGARLFGKGTDRFIHQPDSRISDKETLCEIRKQYPDIKITKADNLYSNDGMNDGGWSMAVKVENK